MYNAERLNAEAAEHAGNAAERYKNLAQKILKKLKKSCNCRPMSNGCWIDVNYTIPDIMRQIASLCLHCGYRKDEVLLYGVKWIKLELKNYDDFEDTSPEYCRVGDKVIEGKTWVDILAEIADGEIRKNNPALEDLYRSNPFASKSKGRPFLLQSKLEKLSCRQMSNGYWINVNYSSPDIVKQIAWLSSYCGYKEEQVLLYGVRKRKKEQRNWVEFDFAKGNFDKFETTAPEYCRIGDGTLEGEYWGDILAGLANREIEKGNPAMEALYKESLQQKGGLPFLLKDKLEDKACKQLTNGYYVDVSYSLKETVKQIIALCTRCGYKKDQIALCGINKKKKETNQWIKFDFNNYDRLEATSPEYCRIEDKVIDGRNWKDILAEITNREIERHNPSMDVLYKSNPIAPRSKQGAFLMKNKLGEDIALAELEGKMTEEMTKAVKQKFKKDIPSGLPSLYQHLLLDGLDKLDFVSIAKPYVTEALYGPIYGQETIAYGDMDADD